MKLNEIQKALRVPKNLFNAFGKYHYRNCEDILEAVKPLLGDSLLTLSDEIVNVGDRYYVKATASFTDGTTTTIVTAYAREALDKKGMDDAQITGAASSYARKYALNGLFLIDDTKDADNDDNTQKPEPPLGKKTAPQGDTRPAKIKTLLASLYESFPKNPTIKDVRNYVHDALDGMELIPENYDTIISQLDAKLDATDPTK